MKAFLKSTLVALLLPVSAQAFPKALDCGNFVDPEVKTTVVMTAKDAGYVQFELSKSETDPEQVISLEMAYHPDMSTKTKTVMVVGLFMGAGTLDFNNKALASLEVGKSLKSRFQADIEGSTTDVVLACKRVQ